MLRNVAGQKWRVYAWHVTTGLPATGDAANISAIITKDDGSVASTNDASPTEVNSTAQPGYYDFDLTQAESNAAKISLSPISSSPNVLVFACPPVVYTRPQYFSLLGVTSAGKVPATIATGDLANNAITSAVIANGAFTAAKFASDFFAGIWGVATSGLATAGSIGKLLVDMLNASVGSRAAPGDEMALTSEAETALIAALEAEIADDETGEAIKQAIIDKLLDNLPDIDDLTLDAIASTTRDAILDRVLAGNHDEDDTVGKLLQDAAAAVTSETHGNAAIQTAVALIPTSNPTAEQIRTEIDENSTQLAALRKLAEADAVIDTQTTPWQLVLIERGTGPLGEGTELLRKDLTDVAGNGVSDTTTVIGGALQA